MIRHILFDLDGTLVDSADSISWTFIETAKEFSPIEATQDQVIPFLGGFRLTVFEDIFHLSGETLLAAKARYGVLINSVGYLKEKLYPGIRELLTELSRFPDVSLSICSARPAHNSAQSLEYAEIDSLFTYVIGPQNRGEGNKAAVLYSFLTEQGIDPGEVLMVGDMPGDIHAAKENGVPSVAVTYGFGIREDLEAMGAEYVANSVEELSSMLLHLLTDRR